MVATLTDEVLAAGAAAGLDRVGVTDAAPFTVARDVIEERKSAGLHGGMQFTYRNPTRSTTPADVVPGARSVVVAALSYPSTRDDADDVGSASGRPLARVARYATEDHYARLRAGLDVMADRLRADGWTARVVADDNALVDRAAAFRAGIGWYGKNANILVGDVGSWFVLGSVVTDAPLVPNQPVADEAAAMRDGCGPCTRCLTQCPTGAIVAPGVVDARRCLAWLVQAEGTFPLEHRAALGDRIYGCDVCQEVCPPSIRIGRRSATAVGGESTVDVLDLLAASDDELLAAHGRWYIPRRDPRYLRRNALVVLGNVATVPVTDEVRAALARWCASDDDLLREHAGWAAGRLGLTELEAVAAAGLAGQASARAGSSPS